MGQTPGASQARKHLVEGKLLARLIDRRFESRAEFARNMEVSPHKVSYWTRGITRLKGEERRQALSLLDASEEDLTPSVYQSEEANKASSGTDRNNLGPDIAIEDDGYEEVPVYGALSAGAMEYTDSDVVTTVKIPRRKNKQHKIWGRFVRGRSMEDEFQDGDIVIFESRPHEDGHAVHAFAEGDDAFKVYRKTAEGERLAPTNPDFDTLPAREYNIAGIAMYRVRTEKDYVDIRMYTGGYRARV